jgi:hypothetical protein
MTQPQWNGICLFAFGVLLLLANKPFSKGCQQFQGEMFKRDYGIWSFRIPAILIGALLTLLGIGFFFF